MQVMVANIRCGEILNDQLRSLQEDQAWTSLVENAQQHLVPTFGGQASNLLGSCLAGMLYTNSNPQECAVVHWLAALYPTVLHLQPCVLNIRLDSILGTV